MLGRRQLRARWRRVGRALVVLDVRPPILDGASHRTGLTLLCVRDRLLYLRSPAPFVAPDLPSLVALSLCARNFFVKPSLVLFPKEVGVGIACRTRSPLRVLLHGQR